MKRFDCKLRFVFLDVSIVNFGPLGDADFFAEKFFLWHFFSPVPKPWERLFFSVHFKIPRKKENSTAENFELNFSRPKKKFETKKVFLTAVSPFKNWRLNWYHHSLEGNKTFWRERKKSFSVAIKQIAEIGLNLLLSQRSRFSILQTQKRNAQKNVTKSPHNFSEKSSWLVIAW